MFHWASILLDPLIGAVEELERKKLHTAAGPAASPIGRRSSSIDDKEVWTGIKPVTAHDHAANVRSSATGHRLHR